jgi:hypothetical protein
VSQIRGWIFSFKHASLCCLLYSCVSLHSYLFGDDWCTRTLRLCWMISKFKLEKRFGSKVDWLQPIKC